MDFQNCLAAAVDDDCYSLDQFPRNDSSNVQHAFDNFDLDRSWSNYEQNLESYYCSAFDCTATVSSSLDCWFEVKTVDLQTNTAVDIVVVVAAVDGIANIVHCREQMKDFVGIVGNFDS